MAWGFVQKALGADGVAVSGTTVALSFGSAVSSGNLVCGAVAWDSSKTISSIVDDKGNTYNVGSQIVDTANAEAFAYFWRGNITNAPTTVTVTFSAAAYWRRLEMCEFSGGLAATDPSNGNTGQYDSTAATSQSSGSITTTTNGCLIYGVAGNFDGAALTITQGAGFTLENQAASGSSNNMADEYQVQGSAGSIAATFSFSSSVKAVVGVLALKPSATAPVLTMPRRNIILRRIH